MATADALFRDGDLDGARKALVEIVRSRPSDQPARMFLFQLLALAGEWEKARTQLTMLAQLSPEAQMLAVSYNQAIDAELLRAEVFAGRQPAPMLARNSPWAQDIADAIGHFAAGRIAEGEAARERAFDAAADTPGTLDGVAFDWIADADSRFGPAFEAIVAGQWGIIPFDAIESIKSDGAKDLRDLVWFPVQIGWKTGQSVAGMLPARYPGSEAAADSAVRMGRATDWADAEWGETGLGQHLLTLSGGEERPLLELRQLSFA